MKKPVTRWKKWHFFRARNEAKRVGAALRKRRARTSRRGHRVTLWDGTEFREAICLGEPMLPPRVLCLNENRGATLEFLHSVRTKLAIPLRDGKPVKRAWFAEKKGHKAPARLKEYWDFSVVDRIGTAAAVVLASEYDRARRIMGKPPVTIDIENWGPQMFKTLFELGFFDTVGLVEGAADRYEQTQRGETLIAAMISNENGNGLPAVSSAIRELTAFINTSCAVPPQVLTHLNSAIGEAMINVSRHAYESPFESEVAYVPRWWFTAEANRETRKITAVLFDQGATIPVTLPYKERGWLSVLGRRLASISEQEKNHFDTQFDVDAVRYAMRDGTTQTDDPGRGRGLPQMRKLIDHYKPGKLTVMSRRALYSYATDGGVYSSQLELPIGGTLLEWEIEVPR